MRKKKIINQVLYRIHAAKTLSCTQIITVPVICSSICIFVNSQLLNIVESKWSEVRQGWEVENGGGRGGDTVWLKRSWAWICFVAARDKILQKFCDWLVMSYTMIKLFSRQCYTAWKPWVLSQESGPQHATKSTQWDKISTLRRMFRSSSFHGDQLAHTSAILEFKC